MNYLSNKLSKILGFSVLPSYRRSSSLTPSGASIEVPDDMGGNKIIGACHRQQYYRIKGYQEDDTTQKNIDWTLAALMGEQMHEMLVKLIDIYGFAMGLHKLAAEHSFYIPEKNISGRTDLIVWDYNANEPIGIEIKSIGEFKAKKAIEQPIEEHVLQSMVYLNHYNNNIPDNQKKIKKWYLWYVSRTENWSIKGKAHGSDFAMLWDFCITLEDGVPVINGATFNQKWTDYSIEKIYNRYDKLTEHLKNDTVPLRDYEIVYSEEKIVGLHKKDKLTRKADKELVDKWLGKGAPPGKLKITMGDAECMFCEYKDLCWAGIENTKKKPFSNLPVKETKEVKKDIYFL